MTSVRPNLPGDNAGCPVHLKAAAALGIRTRTGVLMGGGSVTLASSLIVHWRLLHSLRGGCCLLRAFTYMSFFLAFSFSFFFFSFLYILCIFSSRIGLIGKYSIRIGGEYVASYTAPYLSDCD